MANSRAAKAAPLRAEDVAYVRSLLLHEDEHLLVFNKPAGLAVQGGSGVTQSLERLMAAFQKSNGKRPRLVHRLDRETSGVIVAARTKPAAALLSQAFAERAVRKSYVAIVCGGAPAPPSGVIDLPLAKVSKHGLDLMTPGSEGQASVTSYRTLAATKEAALLELEPLTGRMHQLRVHLASIGRPIAGDGKYGGLFSIAGVAIGGLMLHAQRLELQHPAGGTCEFSARPPMAFAQTAQALGLEAALAPLSC